MLALWQTPEQRSLRVQTNTLCFQRGPASSAAPLCSQFSFSNWNESDCNPKIHKVLLFFVWEKSNKWCDRKNSDSTHLPAPSVWLFSPSAALSCGRVLHTHSHTPVAVRLKTTRGNLFPNVPSCRRADGAGALLPSVKHWCIIPEEVDFHLKITPTAAADSLTSRLFEVKIRQPFRPVSPPLTTCYLKRLWEHFLSANQNDWNLDKTKF